MDYVTAGLIGIVIVYSLIKDYLHYKTTQDLTKKIMSKDLTDYTIATEKPNPIQEDKVNEELVELEEQIPQSLVEEEEETK